MKIPITFVIDRFDLAGRDRRMPREARHASERARGGIDRVPQGQGKLLRRARRGVLLTIASSVATAVVLMGAGLTGIQALRSADSRPAVGPSTDIFADVHGWIAYKSGGWLMAVNPANPTEIVSLATPPGGDPIAWSSDGTLLLSRPETECCSGGPLFVLASDGSRTVVTPGGDGAPRSDLATWGSFSPDGSMVAYASVGDSRGPYVIGVDGGRPRPLADRCPRAEVKRRSVEVCGEPAPEAAAWSPDGSRIAWLDFAEGTVPGGDHWNVLSFVNPDNTGLREAVARLPGEFGGNSLVWSPDGSRLAFWMGDEVPGQIYVIKADGSGLRRITPSGDNRWPAWSPDGSRIAFVHNGTLYTMAADGSDMHEVKGVEPDGAIAWNPVSTVVSSDHREHAGNARSANAA